MSDSGANMETQDQDDVTDKHILVQFKNETGDLFGSPFDMPVNLTKDKLERICHALLQKVTKSNSK